MKKCLALLLLLLLIFPSALAQGEVPEVLPSRVPVGGEDFLFLMMSYETWTFVTPNNLEQYIDLCTKRGDSAEEVRQRFFAGTIQWEAYHKSLPKGLVRAEIIEDAFTRSFFAMSEHSLYQLKTTWKTAVEEEWNLDRYEILGIYDVNDGDINDPYNIGYKFSYITKAPYPYESGIGDLTFYNGKAYLVTYVQLTPASKERLLQNDSTYDFLYPKTGVLRRTRPKLASPNRAAYADLGYRDQVIFNLHTGDFAFGGKTEPGAEVAVTAAGRTVDAEVSADGTFAYTLPLTEEGNTYISYTATRYDRTENTISQQVTVNDSMAALTLYTYPYGRFLQDTAEVSGKATPGAVVTLQIDEEEPLEVALDRNGEFKQTIKSELFVDHAMTLTVHEEGMEDCVVKMPFWLLYAEASKNIATYQKQLDSDVKMKALFEAPAQYVGKKVKLEIYADKIERRDGNMYIHAHMNANKDQKLILLCDSYFEDSLSEKMILTVYGDLQEPSQEDKPLPRLHVMFISYLKYVYSR